VAVAAAAFQLALALVALVAVVRVVTMPLARRARLTQAAVRGEREARLMVWPAAAVLSLCALRVPTLPLTVQLHLVEQPREHTQVAAHLMPTTRSIHRQH
jgi:hypothetical protein